jgi:predicted RNA-binding Zn-ribbon protein involved in translation (DUF1610 family)
VPFKDEKVRKAKQREYSRRWYLSNKEATHESVAKRKRRLRGEWFEYKAKQKCSKCGFAHPAAIDFHHVVKQHKRSVNYLAVKANNIRAAIREAEEKCIPLCSNCHRILHWQEHEGIKAARKKKGR